MRTRTGRLRQHDPQFDILLIGHQLRTAFMAIEADDGKGEPVSLRDTLQALATSANKKRCGTSTRNSASLEGQRSPARQRCSAPSSSRKRGRIKDAEEEWRADEERRLAEARAELGRRDRGQGPGGRGRDAGAETPRHASASSDWKSWKNAKARVERRSASAVRARHGPCCTVHRGHGADLMTAKTWSAGSRGAKIDAEPKFRAELVEKLEAGEERRPTKPCDAARLLSGEEANGWARKRMVWARSS